MISVEKKDADAAWRTLASRLRRSGQLQESRDQPTTELLHVATSITDPRQRVVFSRAINPAFAIAEVIWILAGGDDLSFLAFWNPRIRRFSDDGLTLCGAYGYRIGSQPRIEAEAAGRLRHWTKTEEAPRIDQLRLAYETLQEMPTSRQVVIQIWDRTLDLPNPRIRSKDVPCNLVSHLMIRHGKLEWLQIMRSNDLFWGFPYNVIQFTTLQEIVAGWLGVGLGTYMHISDSLHAYQRHWNDLDTTSNRVHTKNPLNNASLAIKGYGPWEETFSRVVSCAFKLTVSSSASDLVSIFESVSDILPAYREWLALLTAEALRRRGFGQDALKIAKAAGPYWGSSWRKWAHRAEAQRRVRTDSRFELAGAAPQVRE